MNCPKCGYRRKAGDAATPDWQCPSCGVAYAKVINAANPPMRHAATAPAAAQPSGAGRFLKGAIALVVLGCIGMLIARPEPLTRRQNAAPAPQVTAELPAGAKKGQDIDWKRSYIVMYSLSTCGFCAQKRQEFQANGIPFTEYFMDLDAAREEEFMSKVFAQGFQSGWFGTPSFDVNGRMMINNPPLDELLKQAAL